MEACGGRHLASHFHRFGSDGHRDGQRHAMDEIDGRGRSAVARAAERSSQLLRNSPLAGGKTVQPVTTLHCDFKPANVITAKDGVWAIDFQLSTRASIYFDLAHFLNSLAIDTMKARRPGLLLQARQMHRAFIAGYERVAGPIDPLILAYYLTYDLSRYMVQYGNAQTAGLAGRGRWWAMERLLSLRLAGFRALDRRTT
jgi:thiamine kinase-like enzyme